MKNSFATTLLVLVGIAAFASLGLCWSYISSSREARGFQAQVSQINNNRMLLQALANDLLEYSKKNPSINPILESAGLRLTNAPSATNK